MVHNSKPVMNDISVFLMIRNVSSNKIWSLRGNITILLHYTQHGVNLCCLQNQSTGVLVSFMTDLCTI